MSQLDTEIKGLLQRTNRKGRAIQIYDLSPEVMDYIALRKTVHLVLPDGRSHQVDPNDIENYQMMVDDLLVGNILYLFGAAGTGKTVTAESLCWTLKGDPKEHLETINCSQWTSPRDVIGGETIGGYEEGGLIRAWETGKMLLIDELPKLDPNTAALFNDALAKTASPPEKAIITTGSGRKVQRHPDFMCVATGNTTMKRVDPKYLGNSRQDASLIDRFAGSFYHVGFNEQLERSLVAPCIYDIFTAIRREILKNDIENDITLRIMLNANRTFMLEMERLMNPNNRVVGGKTLRDTVKSYFLLHDDDTAQLIREGLGKDFEALLNKYQDAKAFMSWKKNTKQKIAA